MLQTIKHQDSGPLVVVAKLLTNFLKVDGKVADPDSYIKANGLFDAAFVAHVVAWQSGHSVTADGIVGPATWEAIAKVAPTCSTAKNRISGATMAIQILMDGNITADAIYGPRTKAAVAAYQDSKGLTADGIVGPKTWQSLLAGSEHVCVDSCPIFIKPVDYKQAASPWGPYMYSNHNDKNQTMANSGCGPTSMADIVATLKDKNATPWTLAQLALQWGDRTYNSGTSWKFFQPDTADYYQFVKVVQTATWDVLKACLDAGGYVVCSMGAGYWTKGGHFIVAWKYDDKYVYCNDPASSTRKKQEISQFVNERKQYFCFYPDPEPDTPSKVDPITPDKVKRGTKICDISKYQPTIDYDAFIADTSLIICRAGYRGSQGGIHEDQKFALHADELTKRGVRFGVYFYSIATDAEKAREEARMFYQYANGYNPLFWAMDAEKDTITKAAIVAFVDELRKLGAQKVGCYVANHLYQKYDYASIAGQMDFTWIPKYANTPPAYKCDLWQYTSTGVVGGIGGNVDLNKITGTGHPLEWFTDGESGGDAAHVATKRIKITGTTVNVRSGAGMNYYILGVVKQGDTLPYLSTFYDYDSARDWYEVDYQGRHGWVSSKYSEIVE